MRRPDLCYYIALLPLCDASVAEMTEASNPTCQVCLTPNCYQQKSSSQVNVPYRVQDGSSLAEAGRGGNSGASGVAHVMYGVTFGDLWKQIQSHSLGIRKDFKPPRVYNE